MTEHLSERIQTMLTAGQAARLRGVAERANKTVSAVIREAVEAYVLAPQEIERRERALARLFAADVPVGSWQEIEAEIIRGALESTDASGTAEPVQPGAGRDN